jgi:predicted MFS family arabinose efflux permease
VSLVHTVAGIYITTLTSLLSNGIFFYAIVYFVNEIVKPNERTRGQALAGLCSFGGLGAMIGSTVCGSLLDKYGIDAMMIFCNIMSFAGVMLMLITSKLHKKYFMAES